ncbi:hypothetical protein [Thalassomonas sp. M1454]|uniref:hypothetical protein n=1 Tax=Thalassomonas sp. M1454 TaxID=2594477 RepID=UPI00117D4792|nr:hypothetical protein [Thalassomonas sp. M1454]TRX56587.1 hypothetical protein FNN08_03380 [Thalassomonas sp. M1454]
MKPYTNIAELIEQLQADIQELTNTVSVLKREPASVNEEIILKYIDTASTGKTKDFVRALGVQSERGLFSSGDVSKLIRNGADDIAPELLAIAQKVVQMKKHGGSKR